ncbi:MAG: hypothetical protein ICV81_21145, partial [Flavisolibacter sp.]|nr:hypothetical protein [Flavisolibacter sp.]
MAKAKLQTAIVCLLLFMSSYAAAQSILNRTVPLQVMNQRLGSVLELLSNKGNFYFSYNSNIIKKDSLVTLSASNKTVKEILDLLLPDNYEFRESGNYIIIRKAPIKLALVTNKVVTEDKYYVVSGYVLDDITGHWIKNASIYEKRLLVSALTNDTGYFKIRLKSKIPTAALTVSKEFYEDTTVIIEPKYNQQITVTLLPLPAPDVTIVKPEDYFVPDSLRVRITTPSGSTEYTYVRTDSANVEKTRMGKFLLSSAQRLQSVNLRKFFTDRPFQLSLTPGLSTHGKLSGQVINNFSLNVFGGYSGGVNGLELGGLFNIDRKKVQYAQVAGLFNIVGGATTGLQIAGLNNTVLDAVEGLQIAGINNMAKDHMYGMQLGGIYNHVSGSVKGLQLAGIANFAKDKVAGSQISGVANISNRTMEGVQISGVFNYAKRLKGVQIGLINVADSSAGYSLGLINVVLKGYHKISFSTNELLNTNVAFKTGNSKLYSILLAGMNISAAEKIYSFGYGIGSEGRLGRTFSLNSELTSQYLY